MLSLKLQLLPAVKRSVGEKGSITVMVALFLPVAMLLLSLLILEGEIFLVKAKLQNTADMAALAAVQELDMDKLIDGEIVIREEAMDIANIYGEMNIVAAFSKETASQARIVTWVLNGSDTEPVKHPLTGENVQEARVLVEVSLPWSINYLTDRAELVITSTAEAAVRTR